MPRATTPTLAPRTAPARWTARAEDLRPMLASLGEAPLAAPHLVYEPKYDGIRALVEIDPRAEARGVRLWSRLGNEKTAQFPEVVGALARFARRLKRPVVLDGEVVALDAGGEPAGFQNLQGRIHLTGERAIHGGALSRPVAFVAFDVLRDGADDLRPLPLAARRARLESAHHTGRRTGDWVKIKLLARQSCVVGGWTKPRGSRGHFGALLLGVRDGGGLVYVGHTGTGFTEAERARLAGLMRPLESDACPFRVRPRTNERPHWIRPELVVEVAFTEWTGDGKLRHPRYLGVRDDVPAAGVRREPAARPPHLPAASRRPPPAGPVGEWPAPPDTRRLIARLEALERSRSTAVLDLPGGGRVEVSHLERVLWPEGGITKGELLRYDAWAAPLILPVVADRPLVMQRFPAGVAARGFSQQRAPARVPEGVRVAVLPSDRVVPRRLVGGSLATMLFMAQMAVISQDPWFSRIGSPDDADHAVVDLDPMPGVPFSGVRDVARFVHDELERLGVPSAAKTSGATGLHVYVPLPRDTPFAAARLFCQIVATLVAGRHPRPATVERSVDARGRRVYIDYLQNSRGKTLAAAYSARASAFAGVSTPLAWREVETGVDPRDFTVRTLPARVREVGDLWAPLREAPGADLTAALARLG